VTAGAALGEQHGPGVSLVVLGDLDSLRPAAARGERRDGGKDQAESGES
jgi:hypothetical protein